MSTDNKRGLGKGIGSLLQDFDYDLAGITGESEKKEENAVIQLDIKYIQPNPNQPRKNFDLESLQELAESIKVHGIIQPLIVEKVTDVKYSIIAGERRYRAAIKAGLSKVPVLLRTYDEIQRLEVSLIENIQRENLSPVEEAKAYKYLLTEKEFTQEKLSEVLGKSRPVIANSVRLLQLPLKMLDALEENTISSGHARALLSVINPADQEVLFSEIIKNSLNVRQAEALAKDLNNGRRNAVLGKEGGKKEKKAKSEDILDIEQRFISFVGAKVELKGSLSKGKIVIPYASSDELERIYALFDSEGQLFDNEEEF